MILGPEQGTSLNITERMDGQLEIHDWYYVEWYDGTEIYQIISFNLHDDVTTWERHISDQFSMIELH